VMLPNTPPLAIKWRTRVLTPAPMTTVGGSRHEGHLGR
jgi:hypothetical protein